MSADTRYVAFLSYANDLSAGDTNYLADLYLRDLSTGITSLISVNEAGHSVGVDLDQNPLFSPDGQWVGALSEESRFSLEDRTFIARNLWTGTRQEYSLKADDFYAKIAPLALSSSGAVLYADLRYAGSVKLFSVEPEALEPATWTNRISAPFATTLGGEYLAYYSGGSQGASLQLLELATQELTELYPETPFQLWGGVRRLILSADGSSVVLTTSQQLAPEDNNEFGDVYRLKRDAPGVAELVSVTPAGFSGNGSSGNPTVSADGRFIAFRSFASDLVGGDDNESLDVFLRDCEAGRTWLISASEQTTQTGRGMSNGARLSADGQVLLFGSTAGDLAEGDFNRNVDLLIWELPSPPVGDLDLDFMDDDWELIHFGGFHRDGSLDADGDGLTDWVEFQVATRPGDVTSVWRLELTVVVGQVNELTWSGTADQHYGLHYTDEPVNPEWLPLPGSPFAVESGLMQQIDDSPPSVGARYYRVVLLE